MRRRPPELVQPATDHDRFVLKQLGVPSTWDLRQADRDRASGQGLPTSPPVVTGSISTGEALTNLLQILTEAGYIDDQTTQ